MKSLRNKGRVGLGVLSLAGSLFFTACLVQTIFLWWKYGFKSAFWMFEVFLVPLVLGQVALGLGGLGLILLRVWDKPDRH